MTSISEYPKDHSPAAKRGGESCENAGVRLGEEPMTVVVTVIGNTEAFGQTLKTHFAPAWSTVLVSVRMAVRTPEALHVPFTVSGVTGTPPTLGAGPKPDPGMVSVAEKVQLFHVCPSVSLAVAVTMEADAVKVAAHKSAAAMSSFFMVLLVVQCFRGILLHAEEEIYGGLN
jgi:hypothetical protein